MKLYHIQTDKRDIIKLLRELHEFIDSTEFDVKKHFYFANTSKDEIQYSNFYTLNELGFSVADVVNTIRELTVSDYSETLFDRDNSNPPLLYVFGKSIDSKLIYIKLKYRSIGNKKVICVSFHFARFDMKFPYK